MVDPKRYPPDDPREWLNRARSDLALARGTGEGVYLEDLCYHAQQAAEKAVKGVLLKQNVRFPYTHDIAALLKLIRDSRLDVPAEVREAEVLSAYAVAGRYPGVVETVTPGDHEEAVRLAETVLAWAERLVAEAQGRGK